MAADAAASALYDKHMTEVLKKLNLLEHGEGWRIFFTHSHIIAKETADWALEHVTIYPDGGWIKEWEQACHTELLERGIFLDE